LINGVAEEQRVLAASNGSWSNSPTGYAYQWRRCDSAGANCASISGAASSQYALVSADVGKTLRAVVTASNTEGIGSSASAPSPLVAPAPALPPLPINTTPPRVFGQQVVGKTLRSSDGSWTNNPNRFTYQWRRCQKGSSTCNDIDGATGSLYTAAPDDIGSWIAVRVTAWNNVGSGSASSAETQSIRIRAAWVPS
jgi:hypothetical protein